MPGLTACDHHRVDFMSVFGGTDYSATPSSTRGPPGLSPRGPRVDPGWTVGAMLGKCISDIYYNEIQM